MGVITARPPTTIKISSGCRGSGWDLAKAKMKSLARAAGPACVWASLLKGESGRVGLSESEGGAPAKIYGQ